MHAKKAAGRNGDRVEKEQRRGRSPGPASSSGKEGSRAVSMSGSGSSDEPTGEEPVRPRTISGADTAMSAAVTNLLQSGESVVYRAPVGAGGLRRRASVLRLASGQRHWGETKPRTLVLTNTRVFVLKSYEGARRDGRAVGVKAEYALGGTAGAKEKGRVVVTGVEAQAEAGFVVLTVSTLRCQQRAGCTDE
jgi:hypothetical protein